MRSSGARGFTVVELLISMTIMGIVLAMVIAEFVMVFNHNSLTQANMTAEDNARIGLTKVTNEVRQAMPDITDYTPPATLPPVITNPLPGSSAQSLTYYRVHNGTSGLNDPVAVPTDGFGNPAPCYDQVNLTWDSTAKTITRTVTLQTNAHCPTASATTDVLARNVIGFNVTAPSTSSTLLDIDLQTSASKGNYGVYDLNTQVAVGYKP